jgi:hypothetical protein
LYCAAVHEHDAAGAPPQKAGEFLLQEARRIVVFFGPSQLPVLRKQSRIIEMRS